MKFRPLHDRVVVRRIEEDSKSKGGIIIPDTAKEKPMEGEIVAVGPGDVHIPLLVFHGVLLVDGLGWPWVTVLDGQATFTSNLAPSSRAAGASYARPAFPPRTPAPRRSAPGCSGSAG